MAETVRVEYVLSDRISRKLEKIQKQAAKTELALASIDSRLEKLSKPSTASKFADNWQKSFTKVNKAATTHQKKLDGLTDSTEKWGKAANKARQELRYTRDTLKSLDRHMTTATRGIEKQARAMKQHSDETAQAANHMFAFGDAEKAASRAMVGKNREAVKQRKLMSGLARETNKAYVAQRRMTKGMRDFRSIIREVQDYSFFRDGFRSGATMFQTFTKMLAIIPALTVGLGGVGNVINSIATGVVTLSASLGRLAGSLGAVGGLYASMGIAAGVGKGTVDQLFKPMVKNAEKLRDIERQIANQRRTMADSAASRANSAASSRASAALKRQGVVSAENALSTGSATQAERDRLARATLSLAAANAKVATGAGAAANAQANLLALQEDQAKLLRETNPRFQEFNDQLDVLKGNYRALMSGDANKNIDFALQTFTSLNFIMGQLVPNVQDVQQSIRGLVGKGVSIFMKPSNMKLVQESFTQSAVAVNTIGDILEKVAPLFLRMVVGAQKYANRVLKTLDTWLATKEASGEILDFADKIDRYFHRSEKSLYRWMNILKNVGGAFANIFKAAAPTTERFESDLESVTKNFQKWTANGGNFKKMEVFFDSTYKVLRAVGRLAVSILTMFGQSSGGGNSAKSGKIAESMVNFLDQLGGGLERFGRYAGDTLTTVGPALNNFFTQLGKLASSANLNSVITDVLDTVSKLLSVFNSFTNATGADNLLNTILKFRVYLLAAGFVAGNIVGPFARFVSIFGRFANLVSGGGLGRGLTNMMGGFGGKVGKAAGALGSATAMPVYVTNWMQIAGADTVGDMLGGGLGRGAKGLGVRGAASSAYVGARTLGGAGRVGAAATAGRAGLNAAGASAIGKIAVPLTIAVGLFGGLNEGLKDTNGTLSSIGSGAKGFLKAIDPTDLIPGFDGLAEKLPKSGAELDEFNNKLDAQNQVLGDYNASIRNIMTEHTQMVKDARANFVGATNELLSGAKGKDLDKKGNRSSLAMGYLESGRANSMAEANALVAADRRRQNLRQSNTILAKVQSGQMTAAQAAKMGTEGQRAAKLANSGHRVSDGKVFKIESAATTATRKFAAYKRGGDPNAIGQNAMTPQAFKDMQNLGGYKIVAELRKTNADFKTELETINTETETRLTEVQKKFEELAPTVGLDLEKFNTTVGDRMATVYTTTDREGKKIAGATESWAKRTNAALAGVGNPVASSSGGAGSPGQPATQGLGGLGFQAQFAKGGVIPGNPTRGDVVPIMAAGGEVILNEEQQQKIGKGRISSALMSSTSKHHKSFGAGGRAQQFAEGGTVNPFKQLESQFGLQRSSGDHDAPGVHTSGSYHYRPAPWGGVQAYDYGDARNSVDKLTSAANYGVSNAPLFAESFYDKIGSYVKNGSVVPGQIGGHADHLHWGISASGAFPGSNGSVAPSGVNLPPVPNFGRTNMGAATTAAVAAKRKQLLESAGQTPTTLPQSGVKGFAQSMLSQYGWGPDQFSPLDQLWTKESNWRWNADNPTSDAYGIPQALPGSKMSSAGPDWQTNPATQIKWGLGYIKGRYGNPAQAWAHSQANNWYGNGGSFLANGPQTIGVGENGPERVSIKPLSAGGTRNRNGSSAGGGGNVFNTNISVGVLVGNEAALKQLTEMVGDRFAEDVRKAQATVVNGD